MRSQQISFLPEAIASIISYVAKHAPERGGALMGLADQNVVTKFIPDPDGQMSGASYIPSQALRDRVQVLERQDRQLSFMGVLHSHPGGMDRLCSNR